MNPQDWLLERLKAFGADVYAGEFESLEQRLAHTIIEHRLEMVIAGKREGKPATYRDAWELIYGKKLKDVPRATKPAKEASR